MDYRHLRLEPPTAGVARLALSRPEKKNALNMRLRDELEHALGALAADQAVRSAVLAGGEGIFCAGYDLREGAATGGRAFLHRFREFFRACYCFPKPLVTAVDGPALAGGFDLALAGDFIIASTRARFGHPEIAFAPVATAPLSRFVGPAALRTLCLLGEPLDAEAARAMGIVREVVDPGEVEAAARRLALTLAALPPASAVLTKRALSRDIEAAMEADWEALRGAMTGIDGVYEAYMSGRLGPGGG